ncbi:hypothetical protein [Bradyrhizobium cenepequi]|uniref:hypothetical protein n=1 Tax=Bradyrhizobium cenepequi TaxID=2821403 RepID=UPI001CE3A55A|nr:hypothetical protein [Bradyrhizobium cenepequi]MCA6112653.1 hypothetical protein [Bradyrhizobium cenepequi]
MIATSSVVIDYTISVGNIIEIISIIGGGLGVFLTLKNNVANLKDDVAVMQKEVKKFGEVLIGMARFDERFSNLDKRVTVHDRKIDEIQHGDGFVRNPRTRLDGEYP